MMENNQRGQLEIRSENAMAIPRQMTYGVATSLDIAHSTSYEAEALTFTEQVNYLFSEYFKGLLFVILSSVFIFTVPKVATKRGSLRVMLTDFIKRSMDIVGAVVGLLLTIPVWLIMPIAIKLDSPGPVFYTQTRVGINRRKKGRRLYQQSDVAERRNRDRRRADHFGKPFKVYKFRTMVNDAEKISGPVWATKGDSRITRMGKFMRKTRIDEIPQFLNVLKGEMALVGPRPERPSFVQDFSGRIEGYTHRLSVKPGLTGLAQVEHGYDSSVASVIRKVKYDLEYIEKKSVWVDIKIMLKTVIVVITGKGAC